MKRTMKRLRVPGMLESSELPIALRGAYLAMHRRTDQAFAKYGITADQFVLLATLYRGGPMTQRALASRMPSDPSTVRAMLVLLEKQRLVERKTHPEDSRALQVRLTPSGRRKFRLLWKVGEEIRQQMYGAISDTEVQSFVRNLQAIAQSFSGESLSPSQELNEVP